MTPERISALELVSCEALQCADDYPLCMVKQEAGPSGDFYLLAKDAKGQWLIRAIAVYRGS